MKNVSKATVAAETNKFDFKASAKKAVMEGTRTAITSGVATMVTDILGDALIAMCKSIKKS